MKRWKVTISYVDDHPAKTLEFEELFELHEYVEGDRCFYAIKEISIAPNNVVCSSPCECGAR